MLNKTRVTMVADTVVDGVTIASYGAVLDVATNKLVLSTRYTDEHACKNNKDTVREDRSEFEDFAYSVQDALAPLAETETDE